MSNAMLPSKWREGRLGYLVDTHVPQRDKPDPLTGPIPWVRIEDFDGQEITVSKSGQGVTPEQVKAMNLRVYAPGTVLCSCSCSMGATAIVREPLVSNQTFIGLTPGPEVESRFIFYLMHVMREKLQAKATGAIQQYLARDDFRSLRVPLPPLDEQCRIADFLDAETTRIDRLNCATERQRKLVAERQIVAFHESVQGEGGPDLKAVDPETSNPDWRMLPLNHALNQLTNGYVGPTRDLFVDDGVRYLQSLHIKNGGIDFARKPYFVKQEWADERPRIRLGFEDLLIVQTGAIGEVGLVDDEHVGASCHALLIARTNRSILAPRYLWHAFRSHWGRSALLREQTGALHPHLEAGNVRFMKVPVPALDTQLRVVARTEEIAKGTLAIEQALSRRLMLQSERRQSLITAAVTGQFDVSTASGRNVTDGVTA